MFAPRKIDHVRTPLIANGHPSTVQAIHQQLVKDGWRFYVVDQQRGTCYGARIAVITIPSWLWNDRIMTRQLADHGHDLSHIQAYRTWYLCHEMTHALVGNHHQHGPVFMKKLVEITPPDAITYELGYKPRNAAAAGIAVELGFF